MLPRPSVLTLDQRDSRRTPDAVPGLLRDLTGASLPRAALLPFQRTVGDEVQGVVDDASTALEVVARALRAGVWSIGIGVGAVESPLATESRAARGPAFVRAREAVTRAKRTPHRLAVVGAPEEAEAYHLETVLGLWAGLVERRSRGGWEVHDLLASGLTHSAAARRLGISQSAVSQRAQAAALTDESRARALAADLWQAMMTRPDEEE
jgi:hypothetical protein